MNIYLVGFMGTGKSAVGAALAKVNGFSVVDMDEEIVRREHMSIPEIFERKGEAYFRNAETSLLLDLERQGSMVVSCGGGVTLRQENREIMRRSGVTVYLTAKPETIFERVKDDENRPLLKGKKDVAHISEMMEERKSRYESISDIAIATDEKNPEELATCIVDFIKGF